MKTIILIPFLIFNLASGLCQNNEFTVYPNGFIYSESTMDKLEYIVDSLNLKFKRCELNKTYMSKPQAMGHYFRLEEDDVKKAKKDLENQLPFHDFLARYPKTYVDSNLLIVQFNYTNSKGEKVVDYSEIALSNRYGREVTYTNSKPKQPNIEGPHCVFTYSEKTTYAKEQVYGFFLPENLKTAVIPLSYSRMIQYADCLIDTTRPKIKEDAKVGSVNLPEDYQSYSSRKKEKLLDELRSTRVIGGCSMDQGPRIHAANIAKLSAETTNWEVFLKAHMDILNDRFERASDGNYAWAGRKTYLRELEALHIDINQLILGISLRLENPSQNHYYGDISRIGRALSESNNKEQFEHKMVALIQDNALDDYNRIIAYFLFDNYLYHLSDTTEKEQAEIILKKAVESLPIYLSKRIQLKYTH
jgi:hypothetical protein